MSSPLRVDGRRMISNLTNFEWNYDHAAHLASRCIMGATRDEISALFDIGRTQGVEAAVDSLVGRAEDWGDFPFPDWWDGKEISAGGPTGSINDSESRFVHWYLEQLHVANPLGAKMFKFFVDHVPISKKPLLHQNKWIYFFQHFDLCRKHSLGNFKELIHGVSWSGGMMWTLDLKSNSRPRLNENFGRELLELFTLGVNGGYTEEDVLNTAKAFTGRRTEAKHPEDHPYTPYLDDTYSIKFPEKFYFIDTAEKIILGKTFPKISPGQGDVSEHGSAVMDHIFEQPAAGTYLVWKLWRYFVAPEPPEELVAKLGNRFKNSHNFEIRPLLKDIFMSRAFYDTKNRGNQIKDAADFMVSCLKNLKVSEPEPALTWPALYFLGYDPMDPPSIAGWAEPEGVGNSWLGLEKALFRSNLPSLWLQETIGFLPVYDDLTYRSIRDIDPPGDFEIKNIIPAHLQEPENLDLLIDELNDHFLPFHRISSKQRAVLIEGYEKDFRQLNVETRIRELIRIFMALPEFQLQ